MSMRAVNIAEKTWKTKGKVTNAVAAMIAYRAAKEVTLPSDPCSQAPKKQFPSILLSAIAAQKAAIGNNHGIKRENIAALFIPLGMKISDFHEPLMIQLDNLGRRRGDHVHQSSKVSLPKVRDPFADEKSDMNFLLVELKVFDKILSALS